MTPNTINPLAREDEHEGRERPAGMTEEHLSYLDELRASGITNMFGARPYLQERFRLARPTASAILSYWMATFHIRHAGEE